MLDSSLLEEVSEGEPEPKVAETDKADDTDIDEETARATGLLPGEPPASRSNEFAPDKSTGNTDAFANAYQSAEKAASADDE